VQFLEIVEEAKAADHRHPLKWAIQEAVRRNILRDYLERKGGEVLSILMTEYDYATDMAVLKEESYEDGLFAGLATGREKKASPSGWNGEPTRRRWRRPRISLPEVILQKMLHS